LCHSFVVGFILRRSAVEGAGSSVGVVDGAVGDATTADEDGSSTGAAVISAVAAVDCGGGGGGGGVKRSGTPLALTGGALAL